MIVGNAVNDEISDYQRVQAGYGHATQGIGWAADDRLSANVEGGVDESRAPRAALEGFE